MASGKCEQWYGTFGIRTIHNHYQTVVGWGPSHKDNSILESIIFWLFWLFLSGNNNFCVDMPPPLFAKRIMFLGCPSVHPERFPTFFHRFWPRFLGFFSSFWHYFDFIKLVKSGVSGHFLEDTWKNNLKFGILVYPDHFLNLLDFDHGRLIFLILAPFWPGGLL